jgi:putative ABC transport system ATP-binding protein
MIIHDGPPILAESSPALHIHVYASQSSELPIDKQETQICQAIVPVSTQIQRTDVAPSLIVARNLKKTYRWSSRPALNDISLEIEQGEFVVVTGPSAAGKSTLLHIFGCMVQPSGGTYCLSGSMVSIFPPDKLATLRNQRIGFIFQEPGLLPRVSALKNVALPLLYAGFSEAEQKRRAQKVLQSVGLGSRLLSTAEHLSPRQQQRVAIARALVNSPSLLLADEPTENMDTRSEREIMAILQALNQRKLTIVLATQNVELAAYAKRHVILRDGCIASDKSVPHVRLALDELNQSASDVKDE